MKIVKLLQKIGILSFVFWLIGCAQVPDEHKVTVEELHELAANDAVIIFDVRTPEEIAAGKIKETALEANFFDADFEMQATLLLPKDKNVYIYCKGGTRSAKAVNKLRELGYEKIFNVEGGIKAWKAKGYPLE